MKRAIVTLAIGATYENLFNHYLRNNWQLYCNNFGYEFIVITEVLDHSERASQRSPAWQKLLILSQNWSYRYDRIVWIDSDVIINNSHVYDICRGVPIDKVGAVEAYSIPSREIHDIALTRLYRHWYTHNIPYLDNLTPESYYKNRGIAGAGLTRVVQTGVLVCSPRHHHKIFEYVYNNYEDSHGAEWNYEMPSLSYELIKANAVHWISPRFNFCVMNVMAAFYPEVILEDVAPRCRIVDKVLSKVLTKKQKTELTALRNIYDLSMFMHFAGCQNKILKIEPIINSDITP